MRLPSLLWAALLLTVHAAAQPVGAQSESAVKAAFLYKFSAYVEWPARAFGGPEEPVVIAVVGDDAVASSLEQLIAGRPVEGRRITARRVGDGSAAESAHMLFVGKGAGSEILRLPPGAVLVVTDRGGPIPPGSVIDFSTDSGRVRFSVALDAAEARSLKLSARLLAVAQTVLGTQR